MVLTMEEGFKVPLNEVAGLSSLSFASHGGDTERRCIAILFRECTRILVKYEKEEKMKKYSVDAPDALSLACCCCPCTGQGCCPHVCLCSSCEARAASCGLKLGSARISGESAVVRSRSCILFLCGEVVNLSIAETITQYFKVNLRRERVTVLFERSLTPHLLAQWRLP